MSNYKVDVNGKLVSYYDRQGLILQQEHDDLMHRYDRIEKQLKEYDRILQDARQLISNSKKKFSW